MVFERDLKAFLASLKALAKGESEEAVLQGGWGTSTYVRATFAPAGNLGHLVAIVELRDHEPSTDARFRASLHTEPELVRRFAHDLTRAVRGRSLATIRLE